MHLDYSQQLEIKRQMVIDALERIGKIFDIPAPACIPSPNPLSYRNKIQLPVVMDPHLKMGLYAFNSHEIVEIEKCYIHCQLGEKVFAKVKQLLQTNRDPGIKFVVIKTAVSTNQVLVVLVTDREGDVAVWAETAKKIMAASPEIKGVVQNINPLPGNAVLGKTYKTLAGESFIVDQICSLRFKVSPASFFQVNPAQAENLYRKALEFCELKGEETVLDAYCGVGTLSLLIAPHAKHVIGVECVPEAIADAKENARQNGITNTSFHSAQAEDFIETLTAIDAAVLNPPRKGCEPAFLDKLLRLKPKRIVYVSCDPATLARDLAILQKGYNVNTVQPFDMFPQTIHVESIVQLSSS
jgi:23S rRNA (uracil1939-C5)-methyltransferase